MPKSSSKLRIWLPILGLGALLVVGYFINTAVQSHLGRRALAATGLASLPLPDALAKARAESKLVLVDVSAIWCPSCRTLDREIFAHPEVRTRLERGFVFTRLEYESPEGRAFHEKHNGSGFPTLWLLDGSGEVVRRLQVTFDPAAFLAQLPSAP